MTLKMCGGASVVAKDHGTADADADASAGAGFNAAIDNR